MLNDVKKKKNFDGTKKDQFLRGISNQGRKTPTLDLHYLQIIVTFCRNSSKLVNVTQLTFQSQFQP